MGALFRFNLRRMREIFGLECFVENISGAGDSLAWAMNSGFSELYGVEYSEMLFRQCQQRFDGVGEVRLCHGNSEGLLRDFVNCRVDNKPTLFFLDPHFTGGADFGLGGYPDLVRSEGDFSLVDELSIIQQLDLSRSVIVIDDARLYFDGQFQNGECPDFARCWNERSNLLECVSRLNESHATYLLREDDGYLILAPKGIPLDKSMLNILPQDSSGELQYQSGVAGVTAISIQRRLADSRFATRWFCGYGIDVGGGGDSLALYKEFFPLARNIFVYDQQHGDAQLLANVLDDSFDFLYSSHCLEHMRDAREALENWLRVVKPGGYLVVQVPDEDLYEQGQWPSQFNSDHKISFTIAKDPSWSPVSINLLDLLGDFRCRAEILSVQLLDQGYRQKSLPRGIDQTRTPMAECGIEFVLRKRSANDGGGGASGYRDGKKSSYTVILQTCYGPMMVNKFDINQTGALVKTKLAYDALQIEFAKTVCERAPGFSVFLDIGANFGCYSIACAPVLSSKLGVVHAFEAQRIIANMISGSVALNGMENVFVHNVCVGDSYEYVDLPCFDYGKPLNFGSVEFGGAQNERLSQERKESIEKVKQIRIDDFCFECVAYMKIDVEGMERYVLNGSLSTINRCRPVVQIEFLKSDPSELFGFFVEKDYIVYLWGTDFVCIPSELREVFHSDLENYGVSEYKILKKKEATVDAENLVIQGKQLEDLGRPEEALRCFETAIHLDPQHVEAHVYAGRQLLALGDFERGGKEIVWMWHGRFPELCQQYGIFVDEGGHGIRQDGRTIMLCSDSGLGDTIQFVRYARLLNDLGATVLVRCQSELVRLIEQMEGVAAVYGNQEAMVDADLLVPFHNLIGAFRTTVGSIPGVVPYLCATDDEDAIFRKRMNQFSGLRVGLCWAGNPLHPRNQERSLDSESLKRLLEQPGITFFSLQKGGDTSGLNIVDWSAELSDMAATAALVQNLDLVISVDSSVAHLAGALGRPVWLLNRFDSCWRWMRDRIDSPWYPSMKIFRQPHPGDWESVTNDVLKGLQGRE